MQEQAPKQVEIGALASKIRKSRVVAQFLSKNSEKMDKSIKNCVKKLLASFLSDPS